MKNKIKISLLLSLAIIGQIDAKTVKLDKILVTTPTKSQKHISNVTSNVDVITSDEIELRGYKTISDALKSHVGILLNRYGGIGESESILMDGFDPKRVLVLVDGVRYNDPTSLSGAHFEDILLNNIDHIEIVKGSQSGIWGADATAGVINIITKKAEKEGFSGSILGEYGSFNSWRVGLNSSYKQNNYDIVFDAQRVSSDSFSAKSVDANSVDNFEDDGYKNSSANIKFGYNVTDNDRVETFFNVTDAKSDFDGFNTDPVKAANDITSNSKHKIYAYGIDYVNDDEKSKTKIYINKTRFFRASKSGKSITRFDGSTRELGLNSSQNYAKDSSFTIGVDCKHWTHKNKIDKNYSNQAIFITNDNRYKSAIFTEAVRYDKFDDFKNKITYKLGSKYFIKNNKNFSLFGNYATAYNVPTLYQLYDGFAGNKNLNPEKTKSIDFGINYLGMTLRGFYNTVDEMIEYKTTNFQTFAGSYFNIPGKTKLKGVELSLSDNLENLGIGYNFNYTYLKTEDRDNKELPRRAKNSANLGIDYFGLENTHLGTTISYVGKRKKSPYDKNPKIDYDDYVVVGLNGDYNFNDNLNVYIKVDNLLDKKYQTISGYSTSKRAFYAGFRYKIR